MRSDQRSPSAVAFDLSRRLWRVHNITEGLGLVLDACMELLGSEAGAVQVEDAIDGMVTVADRGLDEGLRALISSYADSRVLGRQALNGGHAVVFDDIDLLSAHPSPGNGLLGFRGTPLMAARGRLLGVVWTRFRKPGRPNPKMLAGLDICCQIGADFLERSKIDSREEAERLLRNGLASAPDAVVIHVPATDTLLFNDRLIRVLGFADRESCERTLRAPDSFEFRNSSGQVLERSRWPIPRAYAGEASSGEYYRIRRRDTGADHSFICGFSPIRDGSGAIVAGSATFRDITEQEHAEQAQRRRGDLLEELVAARTRELEYARAQAVMSEAGKARLLAAASHDLRQPLQAISLWTSLLAGNLEEERRSEIGHSLAASIASMTGMLDSILEHARIGRGAVTPHLCALETAGFLQSLADACRAEVETKGLSLVLHCSERASIHTDPGILERILRNLLSNAVKYTPAGSITLSSERHDEASLRIAVTDTGPGIPAAMVDKIFEEYVRADNEAVGGGRSFGLGLAISKGLATTIGCTVGVRSEPGEGSCFWIDVPVEAGSGEAQ